MLTVLHIQIPNPFLQFLSKMGLTRIMSGKDHLKDSPLVGQWILNESPQIVIYALYLS
jgi:hypothetical protein